MSEYPDTRTPAAPSLPTARSAAKAVPPTERSTASTTALRRRLAELRGPQVAPRPMDARALAALAANPGCRRRALLDGAGVDKGALASALGSPTAFGQSQFAFARGHAFEARVKGDGAGELLRLVHERTGGPGEPAPEPGRTRMPDLSADGPAGRAARTRIALEEAVADDVWALLDHPMVTLDVAGSPAYLEPDAVVVRPDGRWTVVEIKSFPILDGFADPAKVGAAARQAAVYTLALQRLGGRVDERAVLVCPKDFSNLPTAEAVDLRKQLATTRRQLARLTRLESIAAEMPPGINFDPARPAAELAEAVEAVPAAYAPDCLAGCELAFHCRERARSAGSVAALGRGTRGELGGLTTVEAVLAAAHGSDGGSRGNGGGNGGSGSGAGRREPAGSAGPAADALRRAARLRAEALAMARGEWC